METATARPDVPHEAPAGRHWTVEQLPAAKYRVSDGTGTCRYRGSKDPAACGDQSAVQVRHGVTRVSYWDYCLNPLHNGGAWIEDGKVVHWALADGDA